LAVGIGQGDERGPHAYCVSSRFRKCQLTVSC
jgi:hypothetical protein